MSDNAANKVNLGRGAGATVKFRIGRIAIAAIAAEVLGILALVLLVAIFGPSEKSAAQTYAESLGFWVGPISGFVFCLLGGLWVSRKVW